MRVVHDVNTSVTLVVLLAFLYYHRDMEEIPLPIWFADRVKAWFGNNTLAFTLLAQCALESCFLFIVLALNLAERTGVLERYRLQPTSKAALEAERKLTREAMTSVLLNHWLVRPIGLYLIYPMVSRNNALLDALPRGGIPLLFAQILLCMLIDDTWFYWMHRMLHHYPVLYRAIHKRHHRFTRPNVFTTEYAHPMEDLLVNGLGTMLGPLLLGVHPLVFILYLVLKLYQSMEAHSGYNLPFPLSLFSLIDSMDCAPAHDFHHSHNVGNYGGWFMFWDWVCGTDAKYRAHVLRAKDSRVLDSARRPYL